MSLREVRKKSGMTLRDLSEKVGVTAQAISRYEKGERTPTVKTAKKIGKILGISWYDIIDNREAEQNTDNCQRTG